MFSTNKYFSMKLVNTELNRRAIMYTTISSNPYIDSISCQKGVARKQRFIFG